MGTSASVVRTKGAPKADASAIISSAARGEREKLSVMLAHSPDIVNVQDHSGRSAIHLASAEGHADVVKFLIECKANVNARDRCGREPLQEAMINGHAQIVSILREAGACLSQQAESELTTEVFRLCHCGDMPRLQNVLNSGFSSEIVDLSGRTLEDVAKASGKTEIVQFLHSLHSSRRTRKVRSKCSMLDCRLCEVPYCSMEVLNSNVLCSCAQVDPIFQLGILQREEERASKSPDQRALSHAVASNSASHQGRLTCDTSRSLQLPSRRDQPDDSARPYALSPPAGNLAKFTIMQMCARPIARALLDGGGTAPIFKQCASLFFSDVVGFTHLSATLRPAQVSCMLGELFQALDRLAHAHGVQKVDTAGDAYIAAANFSECQEGDHAARLVRFAVDAVAAAREVRVPGSSRGLSIRVGLHCGPVSGILAHRGCLKYTLVGQAALVAARMESTGEPGRIQCSAAMARLVQQQAVELAVVPRPGAVFVPEIGVRVKTSWLVKKSFLLRHSGGTFCHGHHRAHEVSSGPPPLGPRTGST